MVSLQVRKTINLVGRIRQIFSSLDFHSCYKSGNGYPGDVCCDPTTSCTICDDIESPWMVNNAIDCAVNNEARMDTRCKNDAWWTEQGWCRLRCERRMPVNLGRICKIFCSLNFYSCYKSGNGYPGDVCCDGSLSLAAERTFAAEDKNSVEVFEKNYVRLD